MFYKDNLLLLTFIFLKDSLLKGQPGSGQNGSNIKTCCVIFYVLCLGILV